MKKYNKPELKMENILITEAINAMTVSNGKIATYENVDQGTWAEWGNLFE